MIERSRNSADRQGKGRGMKVPFKKTYINYKYSEVYAIIYRSLRIICYNSNFIGGVKLFLIAPEKKN